MAKEVILCTAKCDGCIYGKTFNGNYLRYCDYYFMTGRRRPYPAGDGCTVKDAKRTDKKRERTEEEMQAYLKKRREQNRAKARTYREKNKDMINAKARERRRNKRRAEDGNTL